MNEKKVGNLSQVYRAEEITLNGKRCVLVQCERLELLFNVDNALDIVWAKFKGVNISFLSKNGLNDGLLDFTGNFEGGFLYTCGMDNISSCVKGKPIHGSMHYKKAENIKITRDGEKITVYGEVSERALFGKNLLLKRKYEITKDCVIINDVIENQAFTPTEYVLLYHINYGYPFLDESLKLSIPAINSDPLTEIAKKREGEKFKITPPVDGGDEDVYYHTLKEGKVTLSNPDYGITVEMAYDTEVFPVTLEWKSMISGDYALGIEPSITRFDKFQMRTLNPKENKNYNITISFK